MNAPFRALHVRLHPVFRRVPGLSGGKFASSGYSLDCQPATFAVAGTAATLAAAELFDAQPGAYTVAGVAATLLLAVAAQTLRPDADIVTTGWATAPLWSKIEEETADATVITATAS